jgi:signal peptidase I
VSNPWPPPSAPWNEVPGAQESGSEYVPGAHEDVAEELPGEQELQQGQVPPVQESPAANARWRPSRRAIVEWVVIIVLAVVAVLAIRTWAIEPFWIPSASMSPTLKDGDKVLVNKLAYDFHSVHRGDIIVFATPAAEKPLDPGVKDLIKRVIGLPGETIMARGGYVYIDGKLLAEPWLPKQDVGVTSSFGPVQIPAGYYFVMGDNRDDSSDSRVFGPIPRHLIVGRAFVRIWPVSRWAFL